MVFLRSRCVLHRTSGRKPRMPPGRLDTLARTISIVRRASERAGSNSYSYSNSVGRRTQ